MRGAGFELQTDRFRRQPGTWLRTVQVGESTLSVPVDLWIPSQFSETAASRRTAAIPPHDKMAARKVEGIELAKTDNGVMLINSLDPADRRSIRMKVAGPAALLVAKAYKIRDRAADPRPGREADKDAGDVIRLMRTSNVRAVSATFASLLGHEDPRIVGTAQTGLGLLSAQFGRARGVGSRWLRMRWPVPWQPTRSKASQLPSWSSAVPHSARKSPVTTSGFQDGLGSSLSIPPRVPSAH